MVLCGEIINKSNQTTRYLCGVIDSLVGVLSCDLVAQFYKDAGVLYGSAVSNGNHAGLLGFTSVYVLKNGYVNVKLQDVIDGIII